MRRTREILEVARANAVSRVRVCFGLEMDVFAEVDLAGAVDELAEPRRDPRLVILSRDKVGRIFWFSREDILVIFFRELEEDCACPWRQSGEPIVQRKFIFSKTGFFKGQR